MAVNRAASNELEQQGKSNVAWRTGERSSAFRPLQSRPLGSQSQGFTARKAFNLLLLLIEIAAVLAVFWWLRDSLLSWRSQSEPLSAQATSLENSGTADLNGIQLPGGHDVPLGSVPQRLQSLVQPASGVALPTSVPGRPSRIVIKAIGVDAVIVEGDGPEELKMGVGHRIGTANPGQVGNVVLSGHNDIYGEVFRDLDKLAIGDEVIVYSGYEPFTYRVKQKRFVQPTDLSALQSTEIPVVTLISCYPYLIDTHRIVIVAELDR